MKRGKYRKKEAYEKRELYGKDKLSFFILFACLAGLVFLVGFTNFGKVLLAPLSVAEIFISLTPIDVVNNVPNEVHIVGEGLNQVNKVFARIGSGQPFELPRYAIWDYNEVTREIDLHIPVDFPSEVYDIYVENSDGVSSNSVQLWVWLPYIISLEPAEIVNNVSNEVRIIGNGNNLDQVTEVYAEGILLDQRFWDYDAATGGIDLHIPVGFPYNVYDIYVKWNDGTASINTVQLIVNRPFDYSLVLDPSVGEIDSGSSFTTTVTVESLEFVAPELVSLSVNSPVGFSVSPSELSCSEPVCNIDLIVTAGDITGGETYLVTVTGTSASTMSHETTLTLTGVTGQLPLCSNERLDASNGETDVDCGGSTCPRCGEGKMCENNNNNCFVNPSCGVGLCYAPAGSTQDPTNSICSIDGDCDRVPESVDLCPGTPAGVAVGPTGCPIPWRGDSICNGAETCSTCPGDCEICPTPTPGPGGSGGGSGGGSSSVKSQCFDKKDNDKDGLVDFPNDLGCLNRDDNSEINNVPGVNPIGGEPGPGNEEGNEEEFDPLVAGNLETKIISWVVFVALISGVVVSGVVIIGRFMRNRLLKRRTAAYEKLSQDLQTYS